MAPPPHAPVLDMVTSFMTTRALYVVVELGIPELLADGPLEADEIASRTGRLTDGVRRVLRTLAGAGFFTVDRDRFGLTEVGRTLVAGHPTAARDLVLTLTGPMATSSLINLDRTLRHGRTGVEEAFGQRIFEYLGQRPDEGDSFNRMMIAFHGTEPAAVAGAYDFGGAGHIVDVGGGIGTLLRTVLDANPRARGTLFDQPAVIAHVADSDPRTALVSGDFFDSVPAGGDVYLLSHILHDWADEDCLRILGHCREAMAPGGRLLIVEMVVPDDDAPHPARFLDLIMLSLAGGRERTAEEYRTLLAKAGLRMTGVVPTASPVSVVEAELAG